MNRHTILVVEDNQLVRRLLELTLSTDFQVITAEDGKRGLAAAHAQWPDLVLLDVDLPELDGAEVCRRLKRDPVTREIPVLLLSARDYHDQVIAGKDPDALGCADGYITKPFSPAALVDTLHQHLRPLPVRGALA